MRIKNRSPFRPRASLSKYVIENKASPEEATVYIYDEIGWFGVLAEDFIKDLNDLTAKTIHIRFNTPGGSVFDGTAIFNAIKQHKSKTVSHIDGLAASIASVIALASDEVRIAENAFFMIHNPWSIVIGDSETMRKEADLLDKVGGTIANAYMQKSGKGADEVKSMMDDETWLSAEEALEMGFVDAIDEGGNEKAKATLFDLSVFANVPAQLKGEKQMPSARELERILKEAGCSNKQAKEILASGFKESLRDEVQTEDPPPVQEPLRDVVDVAQRDVEKPAETPEVNNEIKPDVKAEEDKPKTDNYDVLKLIDNADKAVSRANEGGNE